MLIPEQLELLTFLLLQYITEGSITKEHFYNKSFKAFLLNVCGLKSKIVSNDFEQFLCHYNLLCLTETKLNDLDDFRFDGYTFFNKN